MQHSVVNGSSKARVAAACYLILAVVSVNEVVAQELASTATELEQALDQAINEESRDYEKRIELAEQVYAVAGDLGVDGDRLLKKARLVEALSHMRLSNFDHSRALVNDLCPSVDRATLPELRFRCDSLAAGLLLIGGESERGLAAYEALFASDDGVVPPKVRTRSEIGYAIALLENRMVAQSIDVYERVLLQSIESGEDQVALFAGNNLVVILISMQDYISARETLDLLAPVLERTPFSMVSSSLLIHDYELIRIGGEPERAEAGLQQFLEGEPNTIPLVRGSAYRILADTLLDLGEPELALEKADLAFEELKDQAHIVPEVFLTLANIHLALGNYDETLRQLDRVDFSKDAIDARRTYHDALKLQALLGQSGDAAILDAFQTYLESDKTRDEVVSVSRAEFYEAKLTAATQSLELRLAREEASLQAQRRIAENRNNRLWLVLLATGSLAGILVTGLILNRNLERRRLREKEQQNTKLEELVRDKTRELRRNLSKQSEMTRELENRKRIESIGMLASNFAHDFNSLLHVISGSNEIIAAPGCTEDERGRMLSLSNQSVKKGAGILRQLLAYARQQDLESRPIEFTEFLAETEDLLRFAAGEENTLAVVNRSNAAHVYVDPAQLTTSFLNLINNSVDAMEKSGSIEILVETLHIADQTQDWSADLDAGNYVSISLRDSGRGMTATELEQAIEPFYTTKDVHHGSGLGLSSVYGFVRQSGGDLRISSAPGEWTLVEFLLPIVVPNDAADASAGIAQVGALTGLSVLIVEDNDMVADVVQASVSLLHLESHRVSSGQDAKDHLASGFKYDYLLTDVRMPGDVDGVELAHWARENVSDISIIIMTGFSELVMEESEFDVLRKPFTQKDLMDVLLRNGGNTNQP
ncbi:MAG: ATP-binding protein [Pseudomonadota bacterium]